MKSWYYFLLPDGAQVAYKGNHVGEALDELIRRTGCTAAEVVMLGSTPILPPVSKPDYERIKRGVAIGIKTLKEMGK